MKYTKKQLLGAIIKFCYEYKVIRFEEETAVLKELKSSNLYRTHTYEDLLDALERKICNLIYIKPTYYESY